MRTLVGEVARCGVRVVRLLAEGRLHLERQRVGRRYRLPDGRAVQVYRETTRDEPGDQVPVTLVVWFRLWAVPPGARIRQWLFERESLANTFLFAGFDGYARKLWCIDRPSADYAGIYTWHGATDAERYAAYVTRVIAPFAARGSVGYLVLDDHPDIDDLLAR